MNILSDFHHSDLFYGLQLLFEKRLGHNLYRQIGLDWFKEGFWNIYPSLDTAEQYLGMRQGYQPKDGTLPLNDISKGESNGIYYCEDKHNNTVNKAITLDQFKVMNISFVIASIPQHIKPFKDLARMKNAKFIFQQGNMFSEVLNNLHEIPNLLSSTVRFPVPSTTSVVFYHQEFSLDVFKHKDLLADKQIVSFINVYQENGGFEDYLSLKSMLPEYKFLSFGGQCKDGAIGETSKIASVMQRSYFGFHSKRMGDGFGHVLYNWFAVGKPVITRISDYKGKLGEELLTDMETCIDLDVHSFDEVCYIIRNMSEDKYLYMQQQAYQRFVEKVNFNNEEEKIRIFLNNLK